MADTLPSDAKMRAFIDMQVIAAEDITLLSRKKIKDGLAKKFRLSQEQREMMDSDPHYKSSIKTWVQEAIDKKPDEDDKVGSSTEAKSSRKKKSVSPPKKAIVKDKVSESKVSKKKEEEEEKGIMSEFSSLEDDDEPKKKKARKSKESSITGGSSAKSSTKTTGDSVETKLKKLKNYVLLCGTRKSWKKLFEEAGCPDDETASDEKRMKAKKGQIAVVEKALLDLGMSQPFTKAKAAEVRQKKELEQELETIQVANKTEKSTTRGGKVRHSKTKTESPEMQEKAEVIQPRPEIKKFKDSLAAFVDELNDD